MAYLDSRGQGHASSSSAEDAAAAAVVAAEAAEYEDEEESEDDDEVERRVAEEERRQEEDRRRTFREARELCLHYYSSAFKFEFGDQADVHRLDQIKEWADLDPIWLDNYRGVLFEIAGRQRIIKTKQAIAASAAFRESVARPKKGGGKRERHDNYSSLFLKKRSVPCFYDLPGPGILRRGLAACRPAAAASAVASTASASEAHSGQVFPAGSYYSVAAAAVVDLASVAWPSSCCCILKRVWQAAARPRESRSTVLPSN